MAEEHTSYDESLPFRVRPAPNRRDYRGEACYPNMEAAQAHATDLAIAASRLRCCWHMAP